jgi:hypothetical protein
MSGVTCEFISFLLRYHRDIDYVDFASDPAFVRLIRRYENVKYAAELEQLATSFTHLEIKVD